jgi:hypothetical protein
MYICTQKVRKFHYTGRWAPDKNNHRERERERASEIESHSYLGVERLLLAIDLCSSGMAAGCGSLKLLAAHEVLLGK